MRLPRILNHCHPAQGFVYGRADFTDDGQTILIPVRPRKGSAAICSGCHQPAPGYDQSRTPRRFEFIGFWGYLVFLVYYMRRVECKPVSYTHLRAHETDSYLVCRLLLEKKKT